MKAGKIWGQTELIHANGVLEFHRIEYKKDVACSIHKHEFKWNGFFVESGKMMVKVWQKDYDLVDDAHVHMRNDKNFYRQKYFPSMCKMANLNKGTKSYDPKLIIMPLVNDGINSYCQKYNIAKMPDEVFKQEHRKALYDKIYSEEMKEIEKGEYA